MSSTFQDKDGHRKALALITCLFLGVIYMETVYKPYFYQIPTRGTTQEGEQTVAAGGTAAQPASISSAGTPAPGGLQGPGPEATTFTRDLNAIPSDLELEQEGEVVIETNTYSVRLSLLGGRVRDLLLKEYPVDAEHPDEKLNLITHKDGVEYPLAVYSGTAHDRWTKYQVVSGAKRERDNWSLISDREGRSVSLVLKGVLSDGRSVRKTLTFHGEGYQIPTKVEVLDGHGATAPVRLEWSEYDPADEASLLDPYNVKGFVWNDGERTDRENFTDLEGNKQELGDVRWVSLGNKYFMAAALVKGETSAAKLAKSEGPLFSWQIGGDPQSIEATLIIGPKKYDYLESLGHDLTTNINFGYFGVVAAPLLRLLHGLYGLLGNYGLAIVVITIMVKMALYPLNAASFKSMKAMQDLRPEMERIKEQVKDKQQQQMQLMAMYKEKGVNPLGGCLPVVLQMPIFIGLYSALMLAVELRGAPFAFWINDLSAPEKLEVFGIHLPLLVVLFVVAMAVQQWTTPTTMEPAQKKVMMIMPLFMGFLFAGFPAGLTLYMLTNMLISIGQQKGMYRAEKGTSAFKITSMVCLAVFAVAFTLATVGG